MPVGGQRRSDVPLHAPSGNLSVAWVRNIDVVDADCMLARITCVRPAFQAFSQSSFSGDRSIRCTLLSLLSISARESAHKLHSLQPHTLFHQLLHEQVIYCWHITHTLGQDPLRRSKNCLLTRHSFSKVPTGRRPAIPIYYPTVP
jgi:hypothetical protein